jgi:Tat protein translocase TatB subunit
MDFLGIGVPEVVVIIILALIFIGPRDLPRIAARAGKFLRDIRMMSEGFTTEWRREMAALSQVEELKELKDELTSTRDALREAGQEIKGTMRIEAEDLEPDSAQSSEPQTATATAGNTSNTDSDIQDENVEVEAAASTSIPETSDQKTQNGAEDEEAEPETSTLPQSQMISLSDDEVEAERVASVTTAETSDQETQNTVEEEAIEPETSTLHSSQAQTNTPLSDDNVEAATAVSVSAKETADQDSQNIAADEDNAANEEDLGTRPIHSPQLVASVSSADDEAHQSSDNQVNASSKHNGRTTDEVEVKPSKSATTEEPSGSE